MFFFLKNQHLANFQNKMQLKTAKITAWEQNSERSKYPWNLRDVTFI